MMAKTAFITGITGQDGSYLTELLLSKGYVVHGLIRRASSFNTARIDHIYQDPHDPSCRLFLHFGDLTDASMLARLLAEIHPDEIYNLGAQSHVAVSFDMPEYTSDVVALGPLRLLESIREAQIRPRIYQASSSEMYGDAPPMQNEKTRFEPNSPYAVAKAFAHHMCGLYRDAYGLFVTRGILFNHESPRRGSTFVTRKITRSIAAIIAGKQNAIYLGNIDARRDWGYAPEYVEAMWKMMNADKADDFVIATGISTSVREFCEIAFRLVGLNWAEYVKQDQRYFRPKDVPNLIGDASRARQQLRWEAKVDVRTLAHIMLSAELIEQGLEPSEHMEPNPIAAQPEWARVP